MKSRSGPRDKSPKRPIEVAGLARRPALRLGVQGSKFTALDKPVAVKTGRSTARGYLDRVS